MMNKKDPWYIRLAKWLESRGRKRIIKDHLNRRKQYLHRYYLFGERAHTWFACCLHNIRMSDGDYFHNHPAPFFSLVLAGGYWEETPKGKKWRGPWSMAFRTTKSLHRVTLGDKPVWTLFIFGPRIQDWSFKVHNKLVPHEIHLDLEPREHEIWKGRNQWYYRLARAIL